MSEAIQNESGLAVRIEDPEVRVETLEEVKVERQEHKEQTQEIVALPSVLEDVAPTSVANVRDSQENKIEVIKQREERNAHEQTRQHNEQIIVAKDMENVQHQPARSKQRIEDPSLLAEPEVKEPVNYEHLNNEQKRTEEHGQAEQKEELHQKVEEVEHKEENEVNEVKPQQQIAFQDVIDVQAVEESRTQQIEPKEQNAKEDEMKYPEIEEKPNTKDPEPLPVQEQKESSLLVAQQKQIEKIVQEEHVEKAQPPHQREENIVLQEYVLQKNVTQQDNFAHGKVQEEKFDQNKEKPIQPQVEMVPQPQTNPAQLQATNNVHQIKAQKPETQQQQMNQIQTNQVKNEEETSNHQAIQAQKVEQIKKQEQNEGQLSQAIVEKESLQEQQIINVIPTQTVEKKQVVEAQQVHNQIKDVPQQQIIQKEPVESKPQEFENENKQQNQVVHVQSEKAQETNLDQQQPAQSPIIVTQTEKIQVNKKEMQEKYELKAESLPYQVKVDDQQNPHEKVQTEQLHKEIVHEPVTIQEKYIEEQQHIQHHEETLQQSPNEKQEEKQIESANVEEHSNNNEQNIEERDQQQQRQANEAKEEITIEHKIVEPQIIPSNEVLNLQSHQETEAVRKESEHFKQQASQSKEVTISQAKAQLEYQMEPSNKETANFKAEEQSESNHINEPIAEPVQPIVQKQEIIAEIAVQHQQKIEQNERANDEERPISEPSRQPQNPSIHSNKEAQSEEKQENIFQITPAQEQQFQKKKYRLNTQLIDNHQQKIKEENIIEFVEFTPEQKIEIQQQTKEAVPIVKSENHHHIIVEENIDKQLNYTFLPPIQTKRSAEQPQKTIDILKGQISNKKVDSLKEGVGKISRKNLFQKKVHDVIADLKKYDDQKPIVKAQHERKFSSRKRKTDSASKHDNIGLKSNIINVTIGELLSKNESDQAEKLLGQIDDLKKKLHELERKKELNMFTLESPQKNMENESAQKDTIMSNKSNKKVTGRIYRRADSNNSRVTEEIQTQGYMTEKSSVGFMNPSISSAPRQRLSSTQDFPASKTANKQPELENKTGPIIFRVKKNSKTIHEPFDFNLGEKDTGFIKSKEFQGEDKNFQTRREERQDLTFSSQQRLTPIQKPTSRKLVFQEDYKKEVDKYFIELGNNLPKRDWNQQELTQTAKETFKKFGVSIANEKKLILCVKKYKNCVSFILDNARTILWYYQGKFYFGGWKINSSGEGQKNGWGYDYSPGKYVYSGSFVENKRYGHGIMKFLTRENDVIYEGEWKNGFKHGIGKQRDIDGSEYIGSWVQGKKNGFGRVRASDEQGYVGNFLNGVKNGEGTEKFKNGDSYQGSYYDGKFHGMGVYIWGNLSRYEGQFKQGSRNGNGIWISNYKDQNSDRYEGQYRNDRKNGFGVYKWKDGTVYQGQFLNDLKHGQGIVSYGDGKSTKLQWFQGNVVPRQNAERQRSGIKRTISKSNSKKGEQKQTQRNPPLIKFNGNQAKLRPTRVSLGMQQF